MNKGYNDVQWLVQRNLTNKNDFEKLKKSCASIGVNFEEINIVPFTNSLPEFENKKRSIVYGSTTFNRLASESEVLRTGYFYDEEKFSIENYIDKWGVYMLNHGATVTSFSELIESDEFSSDKLLFIRPDDDNKSFSGEIRKFDEIKDWYGQLKAVSNTNLTFDSKIVVSEPYNIQFEWRLWIVNKKVVAASKYREYFKLKKEEGCPADVVFLLKEDAENIYRMMCL